MQIKNKIITITIFFLSFFVFDLNIRAEEFNISAVEITIDKKNWIMVRPSGTEPIIRIYAESDSEKNLEDLISKHIEKIKSILAR